MEIRKNIVLRDVASLFPYEKNTKKHPVSQIDLLAKNIQEFGFNVPILIDSSDKIIAGHGRILAAERLGMREIPTILVDNLTAAQIKALRIADNRIAELAVTDWDFLRQEMIDLQALEYDIDITGYDIEDIPGMASDAQRDVVPQDPQQVHTGIVIGDVFNLGGHRLMCGDSTDKANVRVLMGGKKAALVFTDPPYSVNFAKKSKEILKNTNYCEIKNDSLDLNGTAELVWKPAFKNMYDFSSDSCSFYITMPQGGDQMMMMMMMMMGENWQVKHELIWIKETPVFSMNRLDYDYKHEPIMFGWKKKHIFYNKGEFKNSIWEIARDGNKSHPTMKPVRLILNCLHNSSQKGDIILDLFGGSGSTLIACENSERICYMMELDPRYCQVIINRWEELTDKKAVKQDVVQENTY